MRRAPAIGIIAAILALPGIAFAARTSVVGSVAGDAGPLPFSYAAAGKVKKGKLVPRKVNTFSATLDIHCFNPSGDQVVSMESNTLPIGALGTLRVNKRGRFLGEAVSGGWDITISGVLRKGKAHGLLALQQGTKGSNDFCSTGTYLNPAVSWHARVIPPACASSAAAERREYRCALPPGY